MRETVQANVALPLPAIRAFCQKWDIVEFALFGSVLREDFGPESDIDVLVRFRSGVRHGLRDWLAMGDELEAILGRRVDLIERQTLETSRNYIRRKAILDSLEVIYAE
ncbi:MAG: nucleotidyltransferase family protein [Anaerolineae bacterium]